MRLVKVDVGQGKAVETWLVLVMSGENEPGWMRFGEFC